MVGPMKKLLCFLIGHSMTPKPWEKYSYSAAGNKWIRFWPCKRCGKHMYAQIIKSESPPSDERSPT